MELLFIAHEDLNNVILSFEGLSNDEVWIKIDQECPEGIICRVG